MKSVCCYEIDLPEMEAGLNDPETLLRIYVNGDLVVDDRIPNDTVTLGVSVVKDSQVMIVTGQNDKANDLQIKWVTNPAQIDCEAINPGDYSRVEHVHETEASEEELRGGVVTYGTRCRHDMPVVEVKTAEEPAPEVPQAPAESTSEIQTPADDVPPTTTEEPPAPKESTNSEGPLV